MLNYIEKDGEERFEAKDTPREGTAERIEGLIRKSCEESEAKGPDLRHTLHALAGMKPGKGVPEGDMPAEV